MARYHTLLRISLDSQSYKQEEIPQEYEKKFLGGKGIGTAYLLKEIKQGIDPLGPLNKFIISTGPLNGTTAPASSRIEIVTKSPLTGIYLDCNSGGHFAEELKATGNDVVIFEGVSAKPVVIYIHNNKVSFIDASNLWGMHIYETENKVRQMLGEPGVRVMSIGPAGENLVRFASISNDYSRNAARGGSGAVLGSKKIKAIAVRGTRDIPIADLKNFIKAVKKANKIIFDNPWVAEQRQYGTPRSVAPVNMNGLMPVNNFTEGQLPSVNSIDEKAFENLTVQRLSCGECPVACAKGYGKGKIELEGPEYETIGLFGPNLGILDPDLIAEFNYYCNEYGLDTISAGSLLGAVLATGKAGKESSGKKRYVVLKLLRDITFRKGIGNILAEGLKSAGRELGISYFIPQVKGMGIPAYDPRCSEGTALVYMTADRGACHLRSWPLGRELAGVWDADDTDGRVKFVKEQQDEKAAEESIIVCQFAYGIGLLNDILPEMVSISTGENWTLKKMRLAGERIWNLSRIFNLREGITRDDDYLPEKFAKEGIKKGPLKGKVMSKSKQDYMLDKYYEFRGWSKNGAPLESTLKRLEIEDLI